MNELHPLVEQGEFMCISCIEFDDGTVSAQPLQVGDEDSCQRVMELVPAINYSGDKTPIDAWLTIIKTQTWVDQLPESRCN